MKTYFVTGATGVVGSAVVEQLLRLPDARMVLLVRASDDVRLRARAATLAGYWGQPIAALEERLQWMRGDTTIDGFGLASSEYRALTAQTTHIIHCAGAVRMNLQIEAARASAVSAAQNVLGCARAVADRLEKVEFVSTVGVAGRRPGVLEETWLRAPRGFHNTYEQAKAEAEVVIEAAVAEGLPITVHRPSMVVGDAASGRIIHFQVFYHLAEFLCGTRTRGLFPDTGATQLDLIPADFVARVLVWSSMQSATIGSVLHLCSGPDAALSLKEVRHVIQQRFDAAGIAVTTGVTLPVGVFRALARGLEMILPPKQRRAIAALPVFLDYLAEAQTFANTSTAAALRVADVQTPAMRTFLTPVLDYYLARRSQLSAAAD